MNYADSIHERWRQRDMAAPLHKHIELVRNATLAASSHNTQPWRFIIRAASISILPDFQRRCPEVDPDDHHLYASLGCATENLVLAAQAVGLACHVSYQAATSGIQVDLETGPPVRSQRFEAIPERQCCRAKFDGTGLTAAQLHRLDDASRGEGVSAMFLTEPRQKEQIAEYVAAGNAVQFGDARWAAEMKKWIRFNAREARRTGDGLYGATLGIPEVPRWLGRGMMRFAASARGQSDKDRAHIHSSGAIAVLFSAGDDKQHWIEAGRSYERLALEASALGLSTAFINQPVEVAAIRSQLASHLGIGRARPDLIVRLGRGPKMPRSLRRPVEQVLIGA